jgi:hypothetical protein
MMRRMIDHLEEYGRGDDERRRLLEMLAPAPAPDSGEAAP